ncbi:MAG: PspC domain-containing protein [Chitinophagaceae bacterium]|nr:MAG: PspC domain-containing protein [Chitinophagaceae bacterium]
MKKIININLSGRVIPIEDSAYEKLQAYIESLRRYFANEEGRDEIINDIESRIAELMNDKVRKGASAVTDADIDEIIASMGRPEDFDADNETAGSAHQDFSSKQGSQGSQGSQGQQGAQAESEPFTRTRPRTRLYRNTSDKFVGGVCSGIAAYLNVDPAIVRILFAIITFGGFGIGFLIYILLWMILPTSDLDGYRGKRLYRNPEDKVIGGVAGGLAAYFNKEARIIRLIFAGPLLLSLVLAVIDGVFSWNHHFDFFPSLVFGSLNATLCMIYIVLWIVLPEARTNYEKMEMRGEPVDLQSIRQNVREQMGNVNERMKSWGEEVKQSAQEWSKKASDYASTRGKTFASEVGSTAGRTGAGIGHAIGVLFKVFFMFIFGAIAFGLFVAVIALIFGGAAWWPVNNFIWTGNSQQLYAWGTLLFFLAVPLIGIITWIVRRLLKVRSRNSYLGWTFGFLWTIGWVAMILLVSSISNDFRNKESVAVPIQVNQPAQDRMILTITDPVLYNNSNFMWSSHTGEGFSLTDDTLKLSQVNIRFEKSSNADYRVTLIKYGFGNSRADALARAERVQYNVRSYDSLLDLGNGFAVGRESKYRGQHVEIVVEVPVGKKIRFDESVYDKISGVDIDWGRIRRNGRHRDYYERRYDWRSGIDYTMDASGDLIDVNGRAIQQQTPAPGNGYRYDNEKTLEERERIWKEEGERLEREKKQKTDTSRPARIGQAAGTEPAGDDESMDDEETDSYSFNVLSPVDAVVKFY